MALELNILVGTMTGTAELVAQEIELTMGDDDTVITVTDMDKLDASLLKPGSLYLICSSTYGSGDVPDNARAFYESLQSALPNLEGVRYGVIALGDRTYVQTFCFGGKKFDAILSELGASRIGEVCIHDASAGTMPEEVCVEWAQGWIETAREAIDA
ncbi:MAG: nitric oxide synthase [Betaproteobacteria bacterium]|nr:nitric oxide synthase [Betaproteobacteria bacterium]